VNFANELTPELPADVVAQVWLNRFYMNDKTLYVIIDMNDSYDVTGHCIFSVNEGYGLKVIDCHQISDDNKSKSFFNECIEYLDKLANELGCICSRFEVAKNVKVYEKKYDYVASRTVMVKRCTNG
jgi:hypothetical protein